MNVEFNLNFPIAVKLTSAGLNRYYDRVGRLPDIDEGGLSYFPGWRLFELFGDMIYHGNKDLPFDMNIAFQSSGVK